MNSLLIKLKSIFNFGCLSIFPSVAVCQKLKIANFDTGIYSVIDFETQSLN